MVVTVRMNRDDDCMGGEGGILVMTSRVSRGDNCDVES